VQKEYNPLIQAKGHHFCWAVPISCLVGCSVDKYKELPFANIFQALYSILCPKHLKSQKSCEWKWREEFFHITIHNKEGHCYQLEYNLLWAKEKM
jgi:hypothetical protein